ncbi:AAA family ATPase [Bradyrhizobium sp. WSM1253]|uniref:AAA family ATPase n=1 Tax=Bradyrhizobium sp. WSM1253 TaxID=319003 RepID=UPI00025D108E|nr:adenylate/guanylate cyclase domain-containing protein [Bradyrhizobium sp. WSM1253]EIG63560.1 adenylate/guanylate cyclase family protein [Bradyrhizobium sp. WSM1253]
MSHDVRAWLEHLGLGRYAETFAQSGVDFDLLPDLSNSDLKDLGIARLGDRKRLLRAIAALMRTKPLAAIPPSTSEAERRQVTVMFCDLVDSTALSSTVDPEQLRELLLAYQAACVAVIDRYDGHLAKYLGDGLLVYFGLPRAHEDDAQRAVSAGLDIVEAVVLLNRDLSKKFGIELSVRLAVHTGLVVAGEMGAGGAREEMAIVGETPNVAARLQSLAAPNALVISSSTQRLVAGFFTYEDIGVHQLKGVARPVQAWRVTGERLTESRFEALHPGGPFPLIGREEEVNLLLLRWEQVKQGEGQVVLLCGEPGIGKSRIAEALIERIADLPHARLRCQCSAYFATSALYPFARQLIQAAGFLPTDPPAIKLNKLEQMLTESGQAVPEKASLFAGLLSIPVASHYPRLELTAETLKQRTATALVDRMLGLATRKPVLIVVEDAHWIDASSADLIVAAMDRVQDSRVLILITYRPDYVPPWSGGRPHLTMLTLNRLSPAQAADMVGAFAATEALPAEIIQQIVAKADGVPLFIEELTKAVLEAGLADGETTSGRAGRLQLSVPVTLQDALVARLDRTAGTKEVAQVAAVLGREFSEALLTAVLPPKRDALTAALDALVHAGLLFRRGLPPQNNYVFKHALVQDAAYGTLLFTSRQQLHARTADVLEQQFPEIAEAEPQLLAHHYAAAGIYDRAIAYWQRSGTRARERSNYVEAEHAFTAAVALVPQLPDQARKRTELDLQMSLGAVYRALRGSGSLQTEISYRRARALCEEIGDADRLLEVMYGQFVGAFNRPKLHDAELYASEFMEVAQIDQNASALKVAEYLIGSTAFLLGDLVRGRQHLEESLRVDNVDHGRVNRYSHGQYPTWPLTYLAWTMFVLGFPNQGHALAAEAIAASRKGSEFYYAMALSNGCYLHHMCGDCAAVEANVARLLDLAAKKGVVFRAQMRLFEGWTRACRGAPEGGIELMRDALAKLVATEQKVEHPYKRSILAEICLQAGRWSEAEEQLGEGLRLVRATDERWYEAELHRLAAELALAEGDKVNAEVKFRRALTLATAQSARMWELRAAKGLARLWREAGKIDEARALLAPVLGSFTEGFDTRDLIEGRALLDELA